MIRTNAGSTRPRSRSILLLLPLALALLTGCGKENSPTAPTMTRHEVLVLSDGGSQDSMIAILRRDGLAVIAGPHYRTYDAKDINRYAVVVLPCGVQYASPMPDSIVPRYLQYAIGGGGLVTTDWAAYYRGSHWAKFSPLLASETAGSYQTKLAETYRVAVDHEITAGLPASFVIPATSSYGHTVRDPASAKNTQVIVSGSVSGAAVVAGNVALGRIVHWNTAGAYSGSNPWNTNTRRLFVNMVRYAGWL